MPEQSCKICGGDHLTGFCTTSEGHETREAVEIGELAPFDMEYFHELEGESGWIAIGQEFCTDQQYFTVVGKGGEKMGIVGVYNTEFEKNLTHIVVDPKYRGQGIAGKAQMKLQEQLGLPFLTITVDLDNISSIKAAEKMAGVKRTSDDEYERDYHKARFEYRSPVNKE